MDSTLLPWAGGITTQYSSRVINSTGAQISVGASITQGSPFSLGATFHSSLWSGSVLHTASISHTTLETRANSARIHCLSFCDFPSSGKSLSQQQLLLLLHFPVFLLLWKHCFYVLLNHTKKGHYQPPAAHVILSGHQEFYRELRCQLCFLTCQDNV